MQPISACDYHVVRLIAGNTYLDSAVRRINALKMCSVLVFIRAPALPSVLIRAIVS